MEVEIIFCIILLSLLLAIISFLLLVSWFLSNLFDSIQPVQPLTGSEAVPGPNEPNPLFRQIPSLKGKLAWEELGTYPTPIHRVQLRKGGKEIQFWMKREDLCSPLYGGNKVRTLQYQLASCQVLLAHNPSAKFFLVGSGGSNMVVATMTHATSLGISALHVSYINEDAPDMDNTLNLLSTLSLGPLSVSLWDNVLPQFYHLIMTLAWGKGDKVFGDGGNSLGGILGQVGGAIELAQQIEAGQIPDVDEIYLAMGSSCTTAGLILGVCLARHLKMNAFKSHKFKIVSVIIHDGLASLNRKTNFFRNWIGNYFSISPRFGILRTASFLKELTGIDLESAGLDFLTQEWELVDDADVVGKYGAHSSKSAAASALAVNLQVSGPCPEWLSQAPTPWLCGHFTGKAFAGMLEKLESRAEAVQVLFWQTKSLVQPRGRVDEWAELGRLVQNSKVLKQWTKDGKQNSVMRPGKVDVDSGTASDYRNIMTSI